MKNNILMSSDMIYVVDDDKANNFLSKIMLNEAGLDNLKQFYMVEPAITELKRVCTEKIENEYPVVILLDINMPVKDGWDFLNELRELIPQLNYTPKIFITSSSDHPRDIEKAKTYTEIIEFLPKPLTSDVTLRLKTDYFKNS